LTVSPNYTGVDHLEVLDEVAVGYRDFLAGLIRAQADQAGGPRVLDFGAGVGTYAAITRDLGFQVTCAEKDPTLRDRLATDGFATCSDVSSLGDGSFDLVYSLNVLEHIEDDLGALRELHRVTAPRGRLLLYVPAFPVLYSSMDAKVGHFRRYRARQLTALVTEAGYHVQACSYADCLGFPASLAYRLLGGSEGNLSRRSVALYDRCVFPASRRLDRVFRPVVGKNLVLTALAQASRP
jgi:SAM-dependent methyltransferase